ncbi:hypothetical protein BDZ94DRAFT_1254517, partial [Collybia nuda]
ESTTYSHPITKVEWEDFQPHQRASSRDEVLYLVVIVAVVAVSDFWSSVWMFVLETSGNHGGNACSHGYRSLALTTVI